MFAVSDHLQTMGESNAALQRRSGPMPRDTALAAAANYSVLFGEEDGSVTGQFQVLYMSGWYASTLLSIRFIHCSMHAGAHCLICICTGAITSRSCDLHSEDQLNTRSLILKSNLISQNLEHSLLRVARAAMIAHKTVDLKIVPSLSSNIICFLFLFRFIHPRFLHTHPCAFKFITLQGLREELAVLGPPSR